MSENNLKTSSTLTVKVDGDEKELFMSYNLLTSLVKAVGSIEGVEKIYLEDNDNLIELALAERNERGGLVGNLKKIDEYQFEDIMETPIEILSWIEGHLTDFFIRKLEKTKKQAVKIQPHLEELSRSTIG